MQVFLSQTAYDQEQDIILYLEDNWPERVRDNFLDKLARSMEIMESMPYIFPPSEKFPGLRKCVITPQTTAYYRVDEIRKEVEVIAVLDNRRPVGY